MMKVIFIDRDDTIIINKDYLDTPDGIEFLPNAMKGMRALMDKGYTLILVTNQSGIGRGYFTLETLNAIHARLCELLGEEGVKFEKIYFCPHRPDEHCHCRKPGTGMLEQACKDYDIDLKNSVMIGDSEGDMKMAKAFGIKAIQVTYGIRDPLPDADVVCKDILEASDNL
ncbi:MAG: HAD family hydrolase [Victivallales bacterium]|nr:HAD family hydrolase [Victivallales bacterium]